MTVGVMEGRKQRKGMGFSKRGVQGERRSSGRFGRKTALKDEKQKKRMRIIKAQRMGHWQQNSMMKKMSKKRKKVE